MKKYVKALFLFTVILLSGCGAVPVGDTHLLITTANTEKPDDPSVFFPERYFDFTSPEDVYSCCDFYNSSARLTEKGMQIIFAGDENGYCFDPYFSLPSPLDDGDFTVEKYRYAVIVARTSRKDLPGIFRFHVKNMAPDSYPSVYFSYGSTGRQKIILDLCDPGIMFVNPADSPLSGPFADFRLDVYENEADVKDEFVLETVAFFETREQAELFDALPDAPGENSGTPVEIDWDKWLAEEFADPSEVYRARKLLYEFNEGYEFTLESLKYMGYGGVVTNVSFNERYLKDEAEFALLKNGFDKAREMGMETWIYDEYQWPSGKAFGYVLDSDPGFEATGVELITVEGEGGVNFTLPENYLGIVGADLITDAGTVALEFENRSVIAENRGNYLLYVYARRYTYSPDRTEDRTDFSTLRDVDLLNPRAVECFIDLTYEKYRDSLGDTFGEVAAFFTDEPNLGNRDYTGFVVWTDGLPAVFEEMHGYDITDHMYSLYAGQSEQDRSVRVDFYRTVSEMFSRAYTEQIAAWCGENGVSSSGHLLFEESLNRQIETYGGDFMGIVGGMDVPGADILHVEARNLLDENTDIGSVIGIKYVSSAAKNRGKTDVMLEFTPLAKTNPQFLRDQNRYSAEGATIATFCGANTFTVICPDSAFTVPALRRFNGYIGRINAVLDNSATVTPIALFVPTDSARAEHLVDPSGESFIDAGLKTCAMTLLENGLDFTFVDAGDIAGGEIQNGSLSVGLGEYSVILMPPTTVLDMGTAEKLLEFEQNGGLVVWTGEKPVMTGDPGQGQALGALVGKTGVSYGGMNEECLEMLKTVASPEITVTGGNRQLFITQYSRLDCEKDVFYLANLSAKPMTVAVELGNGGEFDVYDPMEGTVTPGEAELVVPAGQGLLIVQ
ncbi:MAG: hypothetical protein E7460_03455 [Ruminococcaceae bacterium]|nr:hypothetical protein [Oscillospiraceae bacterium]